MNSTPLLAQLGLLAGTRLQLDILDVLRHCVVDHRGRWIKNIGDGALAVFDQSCDALACAAAMQHRVAGLATPAIRLRAAVDAGQVVDTGDDVFGLPVVIASRLCALGQAGEVMAAASVTLTGAAKATPHRSVTVKGLTDPVTVYVLGSV